MHESRPSKRSGTTSCGWEMDAHAEGELLRAHRYGRCIVVAWDERRGATVCPRAVMALWYAFVFDMSFSD
nr:MAG TPA: hypothetical protein [Caudoviricetes sp.]